jgi:hypothetical protein
VALAALAAGACTSTALPVDCGPLPDRTACPAEGGGSCADRGCSALYACTAVGWQLAEECPGGAPGGGAPGGGGSGGQGGAGGAGAACATPAPPAPAGAAPCEPLQAPECDESVARSCPAAACSTAGCETFLRCTNGAWQDEVAAYCENGALVVPPRR